MFPWSGHLHPNRAQLSRGKARRSASVRPLTWAACHLLVASTLVAGLAPAAEPWTGSLQGGGEVRVDPRTNRPTVTLDGEQTQLWDGVHKLEDGRELRVESGRVVPNQEILESRRLTAPPSEAGGEPVGERIIGHSPCEELVRKVCGADRACAEARACEPARQLLRMERQEQRDAGTPGRTTFTSGKCREAERDDFFAPCEPGADSSADGS